MLENVFLNTDFDFVYNIIYISEKCTTHMHGREYIPDYISLLELKLLLRYDCMYQGKTFLFQYLFH